MINVNGYTDNILMYFCKPPEPVSHRNYDVCIYIYMTFLADAIEKDNLTSIKQLIEDLGGWPVLNKDWKEENFNLTDRSTDQNNTLHGESTYLHVRI